MTQPAPRTPFVGQIVHYQSYGTPGGEYLPEPRAAIITEVHTVYDLGALEDEGVGGTLIREGGKARLIADDGRDTTPYERAGSTVGLCVLNPTGMFFNPNVLFAETPTPGRWNYMPRTDAGDAVNALVDDVCRIAGWSGDTVKEV